MYFSIFSLNHSKTEFLILILVYTTTLKLNIPTIHLPNNFILLGYLLILLAILVYHYITICHLHSISLRLLYHAFTIFVTQDVFVILLINYCLHYCYFYHSL